VEGEESRRLALSRTNQHTPTPREHQILVIVGPCRSDKRFATLLA